jgi:hypothetical protein
MSLDYGLGLATTVGLIAYLAWALVCAERF